MPPISGVTAISEPNLMCVEAIPDWKRQLTELFLWNLRLHVDAIDYKSFIWLMGKYGAYTEARGAVGPFTVEGTDHGTIASVESGLLTFPLTWASNSPRSPRYVCWRRSTT